MNIHNKTNQALSNGGGPEKKEYELLLNHSKQVCDKIKQIVNKYINEEI